MSGLSRLTQSLEEHGKLKVAAIVTESGAQDVAENVALRNPARERRRGMA
jgi:hypothetical protein